MNFGEIALPSTRSFWEEWDDFTPENNYTDLKWQNSVEVNEDEATFYLLDGRSLRHFIDTKSQNIQLINKIPEIDLNLYRMKGVSKYICTVESYGMLYVTEIVEMLQTYLKLCKEVCAIKFMSLSEYQNNQSNIQPCVIREIKTSNTPQTNKWKYPNLEQPNILSGLSAGVLTKREEMDQSGIGIICYVEYSESYHVEEVQALFKKIGIGSILRTGFTDVINSNLYI